ncbi:glucose-6-phosphate isomerase [Amylibacter sp.]|nr:glucose-6-phosphate isomerase [Amylibacter sp.]
MNITNTVSWKNLHIDLERLNGVHLNDLFSKDPNRFAKFSFSKDDLHIDFSKEFIDNSVLDNLIKLAKECDIEKQRDAMFSGQHINNTENRAVMHVALRANSNDAYEVDGMPTSDVVDNILNKFMIFSDSIRSGKISNAYGQSFTDVISIGIGGSDLGPVMSVNALRTFSTDGPNLHFISNVDGNDFLDTTYGLDPKRTLILIASKTFTTIETMTNAITAKDWLLTELTESEISHNIVALSTNLKATKEFGIKNENVFGFWDWVGGRYSMCASIGLPIALSIGSKNFRELLAGFRDMDIHFKTAPLDKNLPVLLGLIGVWRRNFMKLPTLAIIPYDQRLDRFPAYIQQMDMESNGKSVAKDGSDISIETAPIVWGEAGTNAQHSFFQLLHQGTNIVPVDFIIAAKATNNLLNHHEKLIANFLAQSEALAFGKTKNKVLAEMLKNNIDAEKAKNLTPHRHFKGNKPSTSIIYKELSPFSLGRLIAMYEHKVFVQGIIWGVNSFDQWGVELGKVAAVDIGNVIEGNEPISKLHVATQPLLKKINELRK